MVNKALLEKLLVRAEFDSESVRDIAANRDYFQKIADAGFAPLMGNILNPEKPAPDEENRMQLKK